MSTYLPEPNAPFAEATSPTANKAGAHSNRFLRTAVTMLCLALNVGLIYWAVDARSGLIASQAPIRESGLEPEFAALAVRSAVFVTTAGIAVSYFIARSVEVFILSRLRRRHPRTGRATTVDLATAFVFAYAAFVDTTTISLAAAAPGWLFVLVPAAAIALQFVVRRQTSQRLGFTMLGISAAICALTLLAYGRWF